MFDSDGLQRIKDERRICWMDVTLAVLADAANSTADRKLNILGAFSRIAASGFPVVHPAMVLVLRFSCNSIEFGLTKQVKVALIHAEGQELSSFSMEMQVPRPNRPSLTMTSILEIAGMTFPAPGDYAFKVTVNGDEKASVPLRVDLVEADNGTEDTEQ